jgi:hypothetical protein
MGKGGMNQYTWIGLHFIRELFGKDSFKEGAAAVEEESLGRDKPQGRKAKSSPLFKVKAIL